MGHIKPEQLLNNQIFKEQKQIQDEMMQQVRFGVKWLGFREAASKFDKRRLVAAT